MKCKGCGGRGKVTSTRTIPTKDGGSVFWFNIGHEIQCPAIGCVDGELDAVGEARQYTKEANDDAEQADGAEEGRPR